jgi:recombination protein RecA
MDSILRDIIKDLKDFDAGLLSENFSFITDYVDSGSYAFNKILSGKFIGGGFPVGAFSEIWGESSTAKTVFLTHAFVGAQKKGYHVVMIDNEHAYQPEFSKSLGVDPTQLIYAEPTTVEGCFNFAEAAIKKIRERDPETPIVIGLDSLGTAPTIKELEEELEENEAIGGALRAKVTGKALRRMNALVKKEKVAFILINQVRNKIGVIMGDPKTKAAGGKSLDFYCGLSMEPRVRKDGRMVDDLDNSIGINGEIYNTKNKITRPYQRCEFELLYDKGLTRDYGLTDLLLRSGEVTMPTKGFYSFKGTETKHRKRDMDVIIAKKIESGELI